MWVISKSDKKKENSCYCNDVPEACWLDEIIRHTTKWKNEHIRDGLHISELNKSTKDTRCNCWPHWKRMKSERYTKQILK